MGNFVIAPSRNRMLAAAWAGYQAQMKGEAKGAKKASAAEEKPEVAYPKEKVVRSEPYRRLVAALPCKNCSRPKRSQAAHVPPDGKGIKVDDRDTFPMCATGNYGKGCHDRFDQYELMPRDKAVKQAKKWAAETRQQIEAAGLWPKNLPKWKEKRR